MESEYDKIISLVINMKDTNTKCMDLLDSWFDYLEQNLIFPFEAEVYLHSYSEVLNTGDVVKVTKTDTLLDMEGVLMKIKKVKKTYFIPLVELTVTDENSGNYKIVEAYKEWFDNL